MESLIKEGIEKKEIKDDIEVMSLASFLSSSMEVAIILVEYQTSSLFYRTNKTSS